MNVTPFERNYWSLQVRIFICDYARSMRPARILEPFATRQRRGGTMAQNQNRNEERDFLDDLIDIQDSLQVLSNPLDALMGSLSIDPNSDKPFEPMDYKEIPWSNANRCLRCASGKAEACSRCLDVCPANCIDIHNQSVRIDDEACLQCGLCVAACPTETFNTRRHTSRMLYDQVARAASAYEQCYITCTRALARKPEGNEICLPCVGMLSADIWFSILTDFDNVSVYLPLGVCDRCRTTTGEEAYTQAIATAEEWTGATVGLEVDGNNLNHNFTRAYIRSQFISNAMNGAERLVSASTPVLAGAKAIADRINSHARSLDKLQTQLDDVMGLRTTDMRQSMLTQDRRLVMGALQHDPDLAPYVKLEAPIWDSSKCTVCGDCKNTCTTHAIDIDERGKLTIKMPFCVNCGACEIVCPEPGALTMVPMNTSELVVRDRKAEETERLEALARRKARFIFDTGKEQLKHLADSITEDSDEEAATDAATAQQPPKEDNGE